MKVFRLMLVSMLVMLLAGCAAIGTAVEHGSLQTQTLMSHSVFLDLASAAQKTVYVQERNTTGIAGFSFKSQLESNLIAKGYKISTSPNRAHYVLQVGILRVGRASKTAAKEMMGKGYGGALEGAGSGVAIAAMAGGRHMIGAGLAGAVGGTIVDNMVKDVNYTGVVDIKITVHKSASHRVVRRTRIAVMADRVNLKFADAQATLENQLASSISGIF